VDLERHTSRGPAELKYGSISCHQLLTDAMINLFPM
jgi:hypothetical protein